MLNCAINTLVMLFLTIVFLSNIAFSLEIGNCELKNIQKNLKNYIDGYENHLHHSHAICSIYIFSNSTIAGYMANYFLAHNYNCSNYVFQYSSLNYSSMNVLRSSEGNFIFAGSISEIPDCVETLIAEHVWTTDGYTYFILPDSKLNKTLLRKSLRTLWQRGIYYYVIVFVYDFITIIHYNPFIDEILNVTNCSPCSYFDTVLNMHRHPLRITFLEKTPNLKDNFIENNFYSDVAEMVRDAIKMLNATPKFVNTDFTFVGAKNLLNAYKTDVCLSSLFLFELQFEESSDFINYIFNKVDRLVVVIGKGKPTLSPLKIIQIYDLTTWLTILLTIVAFSCLFKLIERRIPFHSWLFTSVQIIIQISVFRIYRFKRYLSVFIIALVMFTIIINIVFQTNLFGVFIHNEYSKPLDTVQGIADSRMKLVGKRYQLAKVAPKFKKNDLTIQISSQMYDMLMKQNTSVGYFLEQEIALNYVSSIKDDEFSVVYHIVQEAVAYGFNVYMMQKISPYHRSIKNIINLRKQYTAEKNKGKTASKKYCKSPDVIKIVDLVGLFLTLVIGEVLSIMVFLFELFEHKLKKYLIQRNRRQRLRQMFIP